MPEIVDPPQRVDASGDLRRSPLNGYRVRLRVVEEYDVAQLKRTFAEATSSKTSRTAGPEEIVSVEALAVEPYPELE